MKRKLFSLAFMLVFALSTSALADGEIGTGGRCNDDPPPATSQLINNLYTEIVNVIVTVVP